MIGDTIEYTLPMPVRRVLAAEPVADHIGAVALQRGPVVYCAEGVDNGGNVFDLVLPDGAKLQAVFVPELLNGVEVIRGTATLVAKDKDGKPADKAVSFQAVPYYAWANRADGEMAVWLARTKAAVKPRAGRGHMDPVL